MFLNIVNTLWKPFTIGRVGAVTPKLLVNMKNIRKCCIDPLYTVYHGLVTHRWSKHIRRYLAQNCLPSVASAHTQGI